MSGDPCTHVVNIEGWRFGVRMKGSMFRVQGLGFRVKGLGFRV
jgi:hypothetical protein